MAQWTWKMPCIGLLLPHMVIAFFRICDSNPLALFLSDLYMNEDLCLRAWCAGFIQSNRGCSEAPEIALKCNINVAILWLLPLWNACGPSDTIATCNNCVCWDSVSKEIAEVKEWKVTLFNLHYQWLDGKERDRNTYWWHQNCKVKAEKSNSTTK